MTKMEWEWAWRPNFDAKHHHSGGTPIATCFSDLHSHILLVHKIAWCLMQCLHLDIAQSHSSICETLRPTIRDIEPSRRLTTRGFSIPQEQWTKIYLPNHSDEELMLYVLLCKDHTIYHTCGWQRSCSRFYEGKGRKHCTYQDDIRPWRENYALKHRGRTHVLHSRLKSLDNQ